MTPESQPKQHPPDQAQRAGEALGSDPQSLLDAAITNIVQVMGGRAGLVRLWESDPDREIASSSYGLTEQDVLRLRPLVDDLLPRLDQESGGSVLADLDRTALNWPELGEPLRAIALPLRAQGRLIGLL